MKYIDPFSSLKQSMNIFALEGHKVKIKTFDAGYDSQKELAKKYLELNKEYTVKKTIVETSITYVFLKEFGDLMFNSVFFKDVSPQSQEDDMKHEYWKRYNFNK